MMKLRYLVVSLALVACEASADSSTLDAAIGGGIGGAAGAAIGNEVGGVMVRLSAERSVRRLGLRLIPRKSRATPRHRPKCVMSRVRRVEGIPTTIIVPLGSGRKGVADPLSVSG